MLMRMYIPLGEDHGMKLSVNELSEGKRPASKEAADSRSMAAMPNG